jgi:hypothetical protein
MSLLDREAPGLGRKLESLSPGARRRVLANACIAAAERLETADRRITELLAALRSRGELSQQQARAALSLSQEADDECFALQAQGATFAECSRSFSLARLLKSMGVAFGAAPGEGAADAVYELTKTQDNSSAIVKAIESDIESQSRE